MLDYRLDEELEALRQTVREFAVEVVAPVIGDYYERNEFPYEIVRQMGKMGLFGLPFPDEYGGMGGDYFALCIALEELARIDSSVAITLEAKRRGVDDPSDFCVRGVARVATAIARRPGVMRATERLYRSIRAVGRLGSALRSTLQRTRRDSS